MIQYLKAAWEEIGNGSWLGAVLPGSLELCRLTVGLLCFLICVYMLYLLIT